MFAFHRRWAVRLLLVLFGLGAGVIARLGTLPSLGSTRDQGMRRPDAAPKPEAPGARPSPADTAARSLAAVDALAQLDGTELLIAILPWLETADTASLAAFAARWKITADPEQERAEASPDAADQAAWSMVTARWAAQDGPGMMAVILTLFPSEDPSRGIQVHGALQSWMETAPDAALAWAREQDPRLYDFALSRDKSDATLEERAVRGHPVSGAELLSLAARDLPAAADASLSAALRGDGASATFLAGWWARQNAPEAMRWIASLPDMTRGPATAALLEVTGTANLAETLAATAGPARLPIIEAVVNTADAASFDSTLALVRENLFGTARDTAASQLLARLGETDSARALAGFRDLGWPDNAAARDFLAKLAKTDPSTALDESARTGWRYLDYPIRLEFEGWAAEDPEAAISWARGAPAGLQSSIADNLATALKNRPATELATLARTLPETMQNAFWSVALDRMAKSDPANLAATASDAPPAVVASSLLNSLDDPLSAGSRSGVLAVLAQTLGSGGTPPDWNSRLADSLARQGPSQAIALLDALPAEFADASLYAIPAANWALEHPVEASAWVIQLPPGPAQDAAISGMLPGIMADGQFAEAFTWAGSISDETTRIRSLEKSARLWTEADPDTARTAILADPRLTDAFKESILP